MLYCSEWTPNTSHSEEKLLDILRVACLWEMKAARAWAIYNLKFIWLSPTRKLDLAMTYGIPSWIGPAFSDLVHGSVIAVRDSEAFALHNKAVLTLARVKEALVRERSLLALNVPPAPPSIGTPTCQSPEQCRSAWQTVWKQKVLNALLHPDKPLRFSKIEEYLRGLSFRGMEAACLAAQLDYIAEGNVFQVEEQLISEGALILEDWCRVHSKVCCSHFITYLSPVLIV